MFKKILLVDDDLDDQEIIRAAIGFAVPMYECTVANNGREAIQHVETNPYDIILVDLNMPLMNGLDTLKKIKKMDRYKDVPVIIITASTDKYDIERCKRFGAAYYLVKPNSFSELVNELNNILK